LCLSPALSDLSEGKLPSVCRMSAAEQHQDVIS